jgi:fermentation-respiration switch protein FrsA (DUF1100 family)
VLRSLVSYFVFHPATHAHDWQAPPAGLDVQDVKLTSADGTAIHGWWARPAGWEPSQGAMLYCHGNAGNLSHRGEALRRWVDLLGVAVLIFDYPGYGKSGGIPTEAGCYAAADAACDWLTGVQQAPSERILLYGGSLGGAVAIDLASRRPHRALILVAAFASLADMARELFPLLPLRWLVRDRWDNLAKIRACPTPVFIAHGTADRVVPFTHSQRLYAAASAPKRFFPMPGHDHNDPAGPQFYEAVRHFLKESGVA